MEFPYREIHAFEDAQGNFEFLAGVLNQPQGLALSFLQLLSAQKLQLAFGSGSATFTSSGLSGTVTVTHGLGRTPQRVFLQTYLAGGSSGTVITAHIIGGSETTTTFQMFMSSNSVLNGTFAFGWLAIG